MVVRRGAVAPCSEGARLNRARSCDSVSLMSAVMSWECNRALVKILGGGKLDVSFSYETLILEEHTVNQQLQQMTEISAPDGCQGESC